TISGMGSPARFTISASRLTHGIPRSAARSRPMVDLPVPRYPMRTRFIGPLPPSMPPGESLGHRAGHELDGRLLPRPQLELDRRLVDEHPQARHHPRAGGGGIGEEPG